MLKHYTEEIYCNYINKHIKMFIGNIEYLTSNVLYTLDPETYYKGLKAFTKRLKELDI